MKTYNDLYEFIISNKEPSILSFLSQSWRGKDKQESLFRLFAYLNIIPEFNTYKICDGIYNIGTISPNTNKIKLFQSNLKDKGDKSDLTLIDNNTNSIIATTSKNKSQYGINDLDIDNIQNIFSQQYSKYYTLKLCILIRDKKILLKKVKQADKSSKRFDIILDKNTIIFDWNDLDIWYKQCKIVYANKTIKDILLNDKSPLLLRFHQEISVINTIEIAKSQKSILWGHIPRSGKSYIMAGTILMDNKSNYLIITTAPNESIQQYLDIFNKYHQFNEYTLIHLTNTKKPKLGSKNIIICSKQFLQSKCTTSIRWLKDISFSIRFIDESHHGGTTELAQQILSIYGKDAISIFITATYMKPMNTFGIPKEAWVMWDLEDVKLCKTIHLDSSFEKLYLKHGSILKTIYEKFSKEKIMNDYSIYPDLHLMTWNLNDDVEQDLIDTYKDTIKGFSTDSIFLLKSKDKEPIPEFQNEDAVKNLIYAIFGRIIKKSRYTIEESTSIMGNINSICKNMNSRVGTIDEPLSVLCFLPCGLTGVPIDILQESLEKIINKYELLPEYEVVSINSKSNSGKNAIQVIDEARASVKIHKKKGLLVLSGRMCSLAVSLNHCDVVLMMNNTENMDTYFQMMFRSMTEALNKKCGFVIDLNLQRVTNVIINYALKLTNHKQLSTKDALKYVLNQRLIWFNSNEWMDDLFNIKDVKVDAIIDKLYKIYTSNPSNAIEGILKTLEFKIKILTSDQKLFNQLFTSTTSPIKIKEIVEELTRDTEVKKGIEIIKPSPSKKESFPKEDEKNINIISDVMKHLIPLLCLLTIHTNDQNTFMTMCQWIDNNPEEKNVVITQLSTWWGKSLVTSVNIIDMFIKLYKKYLISNNEFNNVVLRLKEMFNIAKNNKDDLSKLIDTYLVPQELEKKQNAEVSTPYFLRQDMLNIIPTEFWSSPKKVFEPCSGKGGFLLDIVSRFNEGLITIYTDSSERYRIIIEECLYWADINPTNIWICKLLLDPFGDYKLNYNEGDTLKLSIKEKWNIECFDLVVGNPPYSTDPSQQDTKSLYNLFVEEFIDKCIYLLYVTPSRWFSGGKGLDKFRNKMKERKDIKYIIHENNASKWFGNHVSIEGGCSYFLKDSYYEGPCQFNGMMYDLSKYDIIIKPKFHQIMDRMIHYPSINEIYMTRGFYKLETNDKRLKDNGKIVVYVSSLKKSDRKKYIDDFQFTPENTTWKVITSRANGSSPSFGNFKCILTPKEIYTNSYIGFKVKTKQEGESLISYLNCKLPNYILSVRKISQDINTDVIKWIPIVPLDRIWTNESVYDYFSLSKEEQDIIEQ